MQIHSESEMIEFGKNLAKTITPPHLIELIGDVGAGKTTFTKGLALGLGVSSDITSPTFTISKRYPLKNSGELIHYDFYRLPDAGLMLDELSEAASGPNIIIIEWSDTVKDILPKNRTIIKIAITDETTREIIVEQSS